MGGTGKSHAVWSTAQLSARGLTRHGIATKVANGELRRLVRGYYVAGDVSEMQVLQALAAGNDGLVFCGTTAGVIYGACEKMTWPAQGYLPRGGSRSGGALLDVRMRARPRTRRVEGLAVITPVQTAVELMGDVPAQRLGEMLARAYPGAKGNDVLASDMAALPGSRRTVAAGLLDGVVTGTASNLEARAVTAIREGLAAAGPADVTVLVNHKIRGYRFDIVIPEARVLIELDSFAFHGAGGAKASERTFIVDRWKGNMATRWGWALLRYTDRCIGGALAHVVDEVVDTVGYRMLHTRDRRLRMEGESRHTDQEVWRWHPWLTAPW